MNHEKRLLAISLRNLARMTYSVERKLEDAAFGIAQDGGLEESLMDLKDAHQELHKIWKFLGEVIETKQAVFENIE